MIIKTINNVLNAQLHNATLIATLQGYEFIRVYVDSYKECEVVFKGRMKPIDIQVFFFNMNPDITSNSKIEDEQIEEGFDYAYSTRNNEDCTYIFTREGWKY